MQLPHFSAAGWKINLGNYNVITELLRIFIVSEVLFLAFELNRPRFESKSLGVGTWKCAYFLLQLYEMRTIISIS